MFDDAIKSILKRKTRSGLTVLGIMVLITLVSYRNFRDCFLPEKSDARTCLCWSRKNYGVIDVGGD